MRTPSAILAGLALASPGALALPQEQAATQAQDIDHLAALVPDDAFAVLRMNSIDELQGALDALSDAFNGGEPIMGIVLEDSFLGDRELYAADQPLGLALSLRNSEPVATRILPTVDLAAAMTAAPAEISVAPPRSSGNYVGICEGSSYELGDGTFGRGMAPGVVSARVNMVPIFETFGPIIEMGMDQMRMMAESELEDAEGMGGMDMTAMTDFYFDGFENFIDSAQMVEVVVNIQGGFLSMEGNIMVAEGSPMAGFGSETKANFAPLLGKLGKPTGLGTFLIGFDYAKYEEVFEPFMDDMLSMYPDKMARSMEVWMDGYSKLFERCEGSMGGNFSFDGGMQMTMLAEAKDDAKGLLKEMGKLISSVSMEDAGYSFVAPKEQMVAGVSGLASTVMVDYDEILGMMEADIEGTDLNRADFERMMEVLYGGRNIDFWMGATGKHLVTTVGNRAGLREEAVVAVTAGGARPSADLQWAMDAVGNRTPSMIMDFDIAKMLQQIEPLVLSLDPTADELPEGLPAAVPYTVYMFMEDQRWSSGFRMSLEKLGEMVGVLEDE